MRRTAGRRIDDLCGVATVRCAHAGKWLESFKEFPPRQKSASFNVDDVVEKLTDAAAKGPGR